MPEPETHCKEINSVDNQSLFRTSSELDESPNMRLIKSKSSSSLKIVDFPEMLGQKEIENLIKSNVSH